MSSSEGLTSSSQTPEASTLKKASLGRDGKPVRSKINVGPSFQPALFHGPADIAYVRPDDRGLGGLLTRHLGTSGKQWQSLTSKLCPRVRHSIFGLPLINPYSMPAQVWMGFMLIVDLIYTAFVVPVSVAFCTETFGVSSTDGCSQVDIVGGVIYLANFLFMFQCGIFVVHKHMKIVLMDGLDVARAYICSWRCLLDVISFLPFIYLLIILGQQPSRSVSWVQLFSLVRLLRLLRMLSISKMVSIDSASGRYKQLPIIGGFLSVPMMYLLLLTYILAVVINLEACILILSAYLHPRDMTVFWDAIEWEDVWSNSQAYQWYASMYWTITTSTSTGYGDITPQNRTEKVLSNVMMIIGMISFGLLIGAFGNLLTRASAAAHAIYTHRKKVQEVDAWLKQRGLSLDPKLRAEIEAYFFEFWSTKRLGPGPETNILAELPSSLRATATERIALPFLRRAPPMGQLPDRIQRAIARLLRPVQFLPGQDICVQGHEATRLWICESGLIVAMQHGGEQVQADQEAQQDRHGQGIGPPPAPVRLVQVPCLLAESVILDDIDMCKTHLWTYRAIAHVQAWELHIRDLWPLLRMFPEIKVKMLLYARDRLCRDLAGEERADNDFCELSELMRPCLDQSDLDSSKVEDLISDLLHADIESGELAHVLSVLAEVCTVQPWIPSTVLGPDASRVGSPSLEGDEEARPVLDAASDQAPGKRGRTRTMGAESMSVSSDKQPLKAFSRLRGSLSPLAGRFSMPLHRKRSGSNSPAASATTPTPQQPSPDLTQPPPPEGAAAAGGKGPTAAVGQAIDQQDKAALPHRHCRTGSAPPAPIMEEGKVEHAHWAASSQVALPSQSLHTLQGSPLPPPADVAAAAAPPNLHDTPFLSPAAVLALQQQLLQQSHPAQPPTTSPIPEGYDPSLPMPPPTPTPPHAHHSPSLWHGLHVCPLCKHVTCPCCRGCLGPHSLPPPPSPPGSAAHAEGSGPLHAAHRRLHEHAALAAGRASPVEQPDLQPTPHLPPGRAYRQGALLSRLMLGASRGGAARGGGGARPYMSPIGRSSISLGATPLERYHSLGIASIPLQAEYLGQL